MLYVVNRNDSGSEVDGINQDLEILYKRIDFNLFDVYDSAPDGDVTFQFALKENVEVCDHGVSMRGSSWRVSSRSNRRDICATGEGEVLLKVRDGAVVALD